MDMVIRVLADFTIIPLLFIAIHALVIRAPKRSRYDKYTRVVMAGLTSYWLAKVIAALWQPALLRPFEQIGAQPGASFLGNAGFPSDHILFATFLTLAVWYVSRKSLWTVLMALMTITMAVGRVLALVHTPLDVVGGMLIAGLGAVWYIDYGKRLSERRLAKSSNK